MVPESPIQTRRFKRVATFQRLVLISTCGVEASRSTRGTSPLQSDGDLGALAGVAMAKSRIFLRSRIYVRDMVDTF